MGPVIRVPADVARAIRDETDLVEVDEALATTVDVTDVRLGGDDGDLMVLEETPPDGFGALVGPIVAYARAASGSLELVVADRDGNPVAFTGSAMDEGAIRRHLGQAYFGEPGDRRPLLWS